MLLAVDDGTREKPLRCLVEWSRVLCNVTCNLGNKALRHKCRAEVEIRQKIGSPVGKDIRWRAHSVTDIDNRS